MRGLTPEQSRVQRAIARPEGVGAPINQRTVLRDKQGSWWWGRSARATAQARTRDAAGDEFKRARHWYERLDAGYVRYSGEDQQRRPRVDALQQRASQSLGMMNVMRALDRIRGLPGPKAGLNEQAIIQARARAMYWRMGAKLADFSTATLEPRRAP